MKKSYFKLNNYRRYFVASARDGEVIKKYGYYINFKGNIVQCPSIYRTMGVARYNCACDVKLMRESFKKGYDVYIG